MISNQEAYENWRRRREEIKITPTGKKLYPTVNDLKLAFEDYIEECFTDSKVPTLAGYTVSVFNNPSTRRKYEQDPKYAEECAEHRLIIEDMTINSGKVDGSIRKLILQSRFNYAEKVEQLSVGAQISLEDMEKYKKELEEKHGIKVIE